MKIQFKKLVWENELDFETDECTGNLVSINDLAEFCISMHVDPSDGETDFRLDIWHGNGHWDGYTYDTIEKCQERANAWWKEKIEDCFTFEIPAIKLEQCIACNGLGQIARLSKGDTAFKYNFETCKTCSGKGKVNYATSETPAQ